MNTNKEDLVFGVSTAEETIGVRGTVSGRPETKAEEIVRELDESIHASTKAAPLGKGAGRNENLMGKSFGVATPCDKRGSQILTCISGFQESDSYNNTKAMSRGWDRTRMEVGEQVSYSYQDFPGKDKRYGVVTKQPRDEGVAVCVGSYLGDRSNGREETVVVAKPEYTRREEKPKGQYNEDTVFGVVTKPIEGGVMSCVRGTQQSFRNNEDDVYMSTYGKSNMSLTSEKNECNENSAPGSTEINVNTNTNIKANGGLSATTGSNNMRVAGMSTHELNSRSSNRYKTIVFGEGLVD